MRPSQKYLCIAVVACVSFCTGMQSASAFTLNIVTATQAPDTSYRLTASLPFDGQVLPQSPETVSVTFSQPPRGERAVMKVIDAYGTRVDTGEVSVNASNLYTSVPADLPPGRYTVRWGATCRCPGNPELSDSFHFMIKAQ